MARRGCQTVATVLKVFPGGDRYTANLVNVYVLGKTENEKVFDHQVLELKRLIKAFNPKETIIDINGLNTSPLRRRRLRANPLNCWKPKF